VGNNWAAGINENKQAGDIVFMTGDFNCGTGTPAMNILKGQLPVAVDGGIDQILSDRGQKQKGDTNGGRDLYPSDHPFIKGSFAVSGNGGSVSTRRRRNPTTSSQFGATFSNCEASSGWPNLKSGVTCGRCSALVSTGPYGGRCDRFCESLGHRCVAAAEEKENNCQIKYSADCAQAITGTSDMLCACERGSTPGQSGCRDGNRQCPQWAQAGECTRNPNYMLANCRCACSGGGSTTSSCRDSSTSCTYWANNGECTKNPRYMNANCKKSCKVC